MELTQAIELVNHTNISTNKKTVWADFGCGSGLFTNALARLLQQGSKIYAVDKNADALKKMQQPNNVIIEKIQADFINDELHLSNLDGILMANSLHFVRNKIVFVDKIAKYLTTQGCFLIVEYDTDISNPWVPNPLSMHSLQLLFKKSGYESINKIHELPSRYNRAKIYSVLIIK